MSDVTNKGPELQTDTLELINTELADRLSRQTAARRQVDTKAALLVGYVAAASSFLATRPSQPVLTWLALAAFAVAAGLGIGTYAVGTYHDAPDPRQFFNQYACQPKSAALAALAARRAKAFESNAPKQRRKAKLWQGSVAALLTGVVLMFAALYVHTDSHDPSVRPGRRPAPTGPAAERSTSLTASRLDRLRTSRPS
jgi:hypothetical protein